MLTLQRASAGSGKTYTLTKKYIRLLISIKDIGADAPRLRSDAELRDSVSHILAVTFTNKATDEMKGRIMSKLNELANHIDHSAPGKTDYMLDFMHEFGASSQEISRLCGIVLRELLYNFSDFSVMTIDSFFQTILRTFAYEADLPEGYELIIENDDITHQVVNSMINDMEAGKISRESEFWISELVKEEIKKGGYRWNYFNRIEKKSTTPQNLYAKFCEIAASLDGETNKEPKSIITEYFKKGGDLPKVFKDVQIHFDDAFQASVDELIPAAEEVIGALEGIDYDLPADKWIANGRNLLNPLYSVLEEGKDFRKPKKSGIKVEEWDSDNIFKSNLAKKHRVALIPKIDSLIRALNRYTRAYSAYTESLEGPDVIFWEILKKGFPRVGLSHDLQKRTEEFLVETGMMKLSDTNTILQSIISEDDVPFIYERYGTRFNHFLIDEFQDTSLLQWKNFRPLLRESESRKNENLIIGDAKQSIYRFRGAEPTLITDVVPKEFTSLEIRGNTVTDNTNYRSARRIVKFNNFFFRHLMHSLGPRLTALYSNVAQMPKKKEESGYVEIEYYDKKAVDADIESEHISPELLKAIAGRIRVLLERGYRQGEIAILTNLRKTAKEIIAYLSDLNRDKDSGMPMLQFVSEDSLSLGSSRAVNIVVQCLQMIQNGTEGITGPTGSRMNWHEIASLFRYYSLERPGSLQQRLEEFLGDDENLNRSTMAELLQSMQAVTLPSLVEALTHTFVNDDMRREQALYLAAFQDAVLAYCDVYPADIASFLKWWKHQGKNISVVSPEGTDAINVMTIHKSKGLEFPCVILPDFDFNLSLKGEWNWIKVPESFPYAEYLPEMMPVEFKDSANHYKFWTESPFREKFEDTIYFNLADILNKAYVAMTRPVNELYIYLPFKNSGSKGEVGEPDCVDEKENGKAINAARNSSVQMKNMADCLREIIGNAENYADINYPDEIDASSGASVIIDEEMMLSADEVRTDEKGMRYGTPVEDVETELSKYRESKRASGEVRPIREYFVNKDLPILQYHPEGLPKFQLDEEDDWSDPRSEGSLLHAVLEQVKVESDLRKGFEKVRVRGLMTRAEIRKYYPMLKKALESVREYGWFDGTLRVMNERPLLKKGEMIRRPDRVLVDSEGRMTVIDYKFGETHKSSYYRQVREYMRKLREYGGAPSIKGYLWFVKEGLVEEVSLG